MKKRIISFVLCLCLLVGIGVLPLSASAAKTDVYEGTATADMNHGVLLYTGYNGYSGKKFTNITDDGIEALMQTTDEVLLIPITIYNCYVDKNGVEHQIISEDVINSMTSDMINYPSYLSSVKTQYLEHASSIIKANYYMEDYAKDAAETTRRLVEANPDVKVWLSVTSAEGLHALTHLFAPAWIDLVDDLKAAVGDEIWTKNVMGIYYATEDIVTYQYTKFNASAVDNDFDSPIVYAMHQVSDAVHAYGKKMLWIPYYHPSNTYIAPNVGYVANLTNIFDTVILQPSYYFNSEHYNSLSVINKCVEKQAIVNSSGSIIGGTKTSDTVIGFEMEIDDNYHTDSAYKARYDAYVSAFEKYVGKYPTAYYASSPDVMIGLTSVMGDFFDVNNKYTTEEKFVSYYGLPVDSLDQWETWESDSALANSTKLIADVTGGSLKLGFTSNGINSSQSFHVRNSGGMVRLQEGDKLIVDIETNGEAAMNDFLWSVKIYFGVTAFYFPLGEYIGNEVGVSANSSNQLPRGKYRVELDLVEILKAYDTANGLSGTDSAYEKVFGESGDNYLCGIYFTAKTSSANSEIVIREFSFAREIEVYTTPAYKDIVGDVENGSSFTTLYTFPVSNINAWVAERTENHSSGYSWSAPLTGADKSDEINGTVTADGAMRLTLSGNIECPAARIENAAGLATVYADNYFNVDVYMEGDSTDVVRWGIHLTLDGVNFNFSKYIAQAAGRTVNAYNQIGAGKFKASINLGEMVKAYDKDNGTSYYSTIFADGKVAVTSMWADLYCNSPANYTNVGLEINCLTFTTQPYFVEYEHNYKAVVTPPTCTEDGYTTYACYCGESYVGEIVEATGHSCTSVVTPPTCTEDGYTTYTCDVCGDVYVDDIITTDGHKYTAVVTPPTCTENGYTTYTCDVCGDVYVDDIITTDGHKYTAVVTPPTCTVDGYTTYTCDCGNSYVGDTVKASGHSYGDWYVFTPATSTTAGEERRECACGDYETREIPVISVVESTISHEIINGKLIITVVTESRINRIALYDADGKCIRTYNDYVVGDNGAYVWTIKMTAPTEETTYVVKCRDAATNSYKNGVIFPAFTVIPEVVFESVTVDVRGDKVYVIATTVSDNYDRVAVVNPADNSYIKYTRNYKIVDGKYEWTIFFDYADWMDNLIVKARDIRTNHYNNAQAVEIKVEAKVEPIIDVTITPYGTKQLLVTVTTIPDLYRVKIAYGDDPTSHIAYARNPVSKTDTEWTWQMIITKPAETTEYAVDVAYVKAYARYFTYITYEA